MARVALTLADVLDAATRPGVLYDRLENNRVRCYACGHRCVIFDGQRGVCKVRFNRGGVLYVPWGYVAALQVDPIEKKPFFHAWPGARTLSFGMLGCDLHCSYCQNWVTSQALRDPVAGVSPEPIRPEEIVRLAERYDCQVIVSTYNEPLITSEWAVDIFQRAKERGFRTGYVSNGNATREVLEFLRPWTDLYKIDLKSFRDRNYRKLGGRLDSVLETIRMAVEMGFWVEVVTLVVPGFNDSPEELRDIARFLVSVSPDIPWHVTAFHKDYKMTDPDNTSPETLIRTARIGYEEGLHYVYAGNLPGMVEDYEHTYCPQCHRAVIRRFGFQVLAYRLVHGRCPDCQTPIPGRWE
ncbi:MAG: AmmeMemoRadiSam system radical SAM enzyme [Acidobacteria bacterium]|nr:AmmeMemoRadiSam system radical SAM enzyme [Acidobacteriota bacterium]MDW7983336.1 AmmeMemoRadiSam system radical SAM enzyme [Acidobacteriota bacterium]